MTLAQVFSNHICLAVTPQVCLVVSTHQAGEGSTAHDCPRWGSM
jgi:hypothetical protein